MVLEPTGTGRSITEAEYDELSHLLLKGLQGIPVIRCMNRGHPALIYMSEDGGMLVTMERTTTTSVRPAGENGS